MRDGDKAGPRARQLLSCAPAAPRRPLRTWAAALAAAVLLAACGGGSSGDAGQGPNARAQAVKPASDADARRFLAQATFGPDDAQLAEVNRRGFNGWIDWQWTLPYTPVLTHWDAENARIRALNANDRARSAELQQAFYQRALFGQDQLRVRMAYALSQIFVVSTVDSTLGDQTRMVASYFDMLQTTGLTTYRQLLEGVARHPAMGIYLSHLRNQGEDTATGRVPDENFAREVMQLFSIGLVRLNTDGTPVMNNGVAVETYTADDVKGLAKVFTGWSWAGPDKHRGRFYGWDGYQDANRAITPMQAYPDFHSRSEKRFLGVTIPAGTAPEAALKTALDTLAAHPNTAPFISRQLIQRLVTSNPSAGYVRDVAEAFSRSGGDMKTVVATILLHNEARNLAYLSDPQHGKLREPVLRLTALLRAYGVKSNNGKVDLRGTDNPGTELAQTPLNAPSVFNFYRPGYVPAGTQAGSRGMVVPEMQIANETSMAGYVNFMTSGIVHGFGQWGVISDTGGREGRDLRLPFNRYSPAADFNASPLRALARSDVPGLIEHLNQRLFYGAMSEALRGELVSAVQAMPANSTTPSAYEEQLRQRIWMALTLAVASPEYIVLK
ncbi:MAG: DUF1800 domain-containing protein [Burkholderiales bacterium]|nr:DUF1800 domain-containing protein [Burkholderiales bacterium]